MSSNVNPFKSIQLSIEGEKITAQYTVDPLFKGRAPYTFELVAYQDESFKEPLYTIPSTTFFVVDDTRARQNALPSFFYKIKLIDANNEVYWSNFVGWHPSDSITRHHYLLAAEMSRRERLRFNYAGLFIYVLKRKSYSATQAGEVDPVTGEPILDDTITFGTGVEGGYYSPVLSRLSIEKRDIKQEYDEQGKGSSFTEILYCRTAGFPFIDQHDIVVFPDGKRFTVTDPTNKYFPGTTLIVWQLPTMRLVPPTDTIYTITVPNYPNES